MSVGGPVSFSMLFYLEIFNSSVYYLYIFRILFCLNAFRTAYFYFLLGLPLGIQTHLLLASFTSFIFSRCPNHLYCDAPIFIIIGVNQLFPCFFHFFPFYLILSGLDFLIKNAMIIKYYRYFISKQKV